MAAAAAAAMAAAAGASTANASLQGLRARLLDGVRSKLGQLLQWQAELQPHADAICQLSCCAVEQALGAHALPPSGSSSPAAAALPEAAAMLPARLPIAVRSS